MTGMSLRDVRLQPWILLCLITSTSAATTAAPSNDCEKGGNDCSEADDTLSAPSEIDNCNGALYAWDGTTFETDPDDVQYWGPCGFPNPRLMPELCGGSVGVVSHICDPDGILSNGTLEELHNATEETMDVLGEVSCKSTQGITFTEIIQLLIIVVEHLRTVDTNNTLCRDDCGQVIPYIQLGDDRNASTQELQLSANTFPNVLGSNWELGVCDSKVIIFFVAEYGKFSSYIGRHASDRIDYEKLASLLVEGESLYAENNDVYTTLADVISKMDQSVGVGGILRGSGPAYMLLVVLGAACVLFLVCFGCAYSKGRGGDYWDEEWWEKVMKYFLLVIFGIVIIEAVIYLMAVIQAKIRPWWILIPFIGALAAFATAIVLVKSGFAW